MVEKEFIKFIISLSTNNTCHRVESIPVLSCDDKVEIGESDTGEIKRCSILESKTTLIVRSTVTPPRKKNFC